MNRVIYAFLSSLIAGLSTCLGMIFTFIKPRDIKKFITISLSLAMGVMTLISIKELIPGPLRSIFRLNNLFNSLLIMVICPLIAMMIINISKQNVKNSDNLYRVGLLNMITLLLHNVPEGIVTFMSSITNKHLGLKLTLAIMAHNIPEGICIGIPIYYSTKSRKKAFLYTFLSGIAEPIGAVLTYLILNRYINTLFINIMLYFIGCLMLLISFKEILPEVLSYKKRIYILYGLLLSLFILFI